MVIRFNYQSERKQTGLNMFLIAQTTVKAHENKNKKQIPTNRES